MGRLEDRWRRRQQARAEELAGENPKPTPTPEQPNLLLPLRVTRTIEINAPREATWAFFTHSCAARLMDPTHQNCYPDPDAPAEGVGSRQIHVHEDNGTLKTTILEVVEFEPGHRIVTAGYPDGGYYVGVTVTGDDTSSTVKGFTDSLCLQSNAESLADAVGQQLERQHARAKAHLEAGWRPTCGDH